MPFLAHTERLKTKQRLVRHKQKTARQVRLSLLKKSVELTAYVAEYKPEQPIHPLSYTQRIVELTSNTLMHIVNGIYKNAEISGENSQDGRQTGRNTSQKRELECVCIWH